MWLTSGGTSIAGGRFRAWQPNHGLVSHLEAVTNVRLLLEHQLQLGRWECERSLARRLRNQINWRAQAHLPDAILHTAQQVAIEIELTLKSRARLEQIVTGLSIDYDRVVYFAAPRPYRTLAGIAAESPFGNVQVHRYPLVAAETTATRLASA